MLKSSSYYSTLVASMHMHSLVEYTYYVQLHYSFTYTQSYAVDNNSCIKVREKKKIYELQQNT